MVFVHFTNRCGSNYFCDVLSSYSRLPSLHESLNFGAVIQKSKAMSLPSFSAYIQEVLCQEPSIVKVNTDQLRMLINWGYIPFSSETDAENKPSIISVQRNDVISQAVSFAIASQTGQFTSFQKSRLSPDDVVFDPALVSRLIVGIGKAYQEFLVLTAAIGYNPLRIIYEGFVDSPTAIIQDVCRELNIEFYPQTLKSSYRKQASDINADHRRKFIASLNLLNDILPQS